MSATAQEHEQDAPPADKIMEMRMMRLLPRAKAGDKAAQASITAYVYERFKYRIRGFYGVDGSCDREDIQATFLEGILRGIPKLDMRGNPLYHLGQRGVWAVQTMIRSARIERFGAVEGGVSCVSLEQLAEGLGSEGDPGNTDQIGELADPMDHFQLLLDSMHGQDRITRILSNCTLNPSMQRAVEAIQSGRAGDPTENGFNRRLADALDCSPQRASQVMARLRSEMTRVDAEVMAV